MKFEKLEDFYQVYDGQRDYVEAKVKKKHIRNFDKQIWHPAKMNASQSVLELGCGTGLFLAYLKAKGLENFKGVDSDENARQYMPDEIAQKVVIGDMWDELEGTDAKYDRIVMLDFFEHFSYFEGRDLLEKLRSHLTKDGQVVMRLPNASSPFSWQYTYGDLTHKGIYGPWNLRHLALAAGYTMGDPIPVQRGSRGRQFTENMVFAILNKALTEPPPLWTANMVVVLSPA